MKGEKKKRAGGVFRSLPWGLPEEGGKKGVESSDWREREKKRKGEVKLKRGRKSMNRFRPTLYDKKERRMVRPLYKERKGRIRQSNRGEGVGGVGPCFFDDLY